MLRLFWTGVGARLNREVLEGTSDSVVMGTFISVVAAGCWTVATLSTVSKELGCGTIGGFVRRGIVFPVVFDATRDVESIYPSRDGCPPCVVSTTPPSVCNGGVFVSSLIADVTATLSGRPVVAEGGTWRSTDGVLEGSVGKCRDGLTTDMTVDGREGWMMLASMLEVFMRVIWTDVGDGSIIVLEALCIKLRSWAEFLSVTGVG